MPVSLKFFVVVQFNRLMSAVVRAKRVKFGVKRYPSSTPRDRFAKSFVVKFALGAPPKEILYAP